MTDAERRSIEVLNTLYAAEKRSLLPRLPELFNFVTWVSADQFELIKRIVADQREHEAWLFDAIERCDGAVYPTGADLTTANLHYLDLSAVMPRVVASVESLARLYKDAEAVAAQLTPLAAETLRRIARRHERHLEQLHRLRNQAASTLPA